MDSRSTPTVRLEEVSVLVVTHDRADLLAKLLESLVKFGGDRWASVVVIDDSARAESTVPRFPMLRLSHRILPERVHITRAKNLGLREISSPYVLIIDDDNTLTESTLARPLQRLGADAGVGAVMPSVLYRAAPELVWVYATPFRADRWGFELLGRNRPRAPGLEGRRLETDALPNAAFFRTEALLSIQGYDDRYVVNSSADLCQRLKRGGWHVEADSGAFVLHDVEPPGRPGYWAAHTATDPARTYHEARDWIRFQSSVHGSEPWFRWRALRRSLGWVVPLLLALAVRRGAERIRTTGALMRGLRDGLREAAG